MHDAEILASNIAVSSVLTGSPCCLIWKLIASSVAEKFEREAKFPVDKTGGKKCYYRPSLIKVNKQFFHSRLLGMSLPFIANGARSVPSHIQCAFME